MKEPIRLMLVDDHEVVRTSLKAFLEAQEGLAVVAEADSGEGALRLAEEHKPDVIVMDITMAGMDGLEATRRLKVICPDSKVMALTVHDDKQYFFQMLSAGALGYVTKRAAAEELLAAIHAVAKGEVFLQPALASWLLDDYRRLLFQTSSGSPRDSDQPEKIKKGLDVLSKRELQVLELVAEGMTNNLVGESLGISPKTVARHRERIMNKLDIHSTTELVKFAIRTGLIDLN